MAPATMFLLSATSTTPTMATAFPACLPTMWSSGALVCPNANHLSICLLRANARWCHTTASTSIKRGRDVCCANGVFASTPRAGVQRYLVWMVKCWALTVALASRCLPTVPDMTLGWANARNASTLGMRCTTGSVGRVPRRDARTV